MTKSRLIGLQYLRGIAALLVVVYHICDPIGIPFKVGTAGVDIFFVISGFVMWVTTNSITPAKFLYKRIIRIVPLYWIVTCAVSMAALLKPSMFGAVTVNASTYMQSLLFIPFYNKIGEIWPIVLQGWTLNIEMFFYVLFAVALCFRRRLLVATAIMVSLVALQCILQPEGAILRLLTGHMLLELLAGLWVGYFYTHWRISNPRAGTALITCGVIWFAISPRLFAFPAVLLVLGTIMAEGKLPQVKILSYAGDASYSLYLWHTLILATLRGGLIKFGMDETIFGIALKLCLAVIGSCILYELVEKKISAKTAPK